VPGALHRHDAAHGEGPADQAAAAFVEGDAPAVAVDEERDDQPSAFGELLDPLRGDVVRSLGLWHVAER
jgi:hypothetical protein